MKKDEERTRRLILVDSSEKDYGTFCLELATESKLRHLLLSRKRVGVDATAQGQEDKRKKTWDVKEEKLKANGPFFLGSGPRATHRNGESELPA